VSSTLGGIRVLTCNGRGGMRRGGQVTPQWGEKRLWIARRFRWYLVEWRAREGYRVLAFRQPGQAESTTTLTWIDWETHMPPKRRAVASEGTPSIPLESESVVLHDFPAIREFLTCTVYEDMTPRQVGYLTIRTRGLVFEVTLYDYDSGQRMACQGRDLDEMFATAEMMLKAENAPWTPDNYLLSLVAKKPKKKA